MVYMRFCLSLKEKPLHGKSIEDGKEIHTDVLSVWSWSAAFGNIAALKESLIAPMLTPFPHMGASIAVCMTVW